MLWLMIGKVGCSSTPGEPHRCLCSCGMTCWCVVCAQDSSGDHRIWQDTTVIVFIVAFQQLGMLMTSNSPRLRRERYWYYFDFVTQSAFWQKDVTLWCSSIQVQVCVCVCVCACVRVLKFVCIYVCILFYACNGQGYCMYICVQCMWLCMGLHIYVYL